MTLHRTSMLTGVMAGLAAAAMAAAPVAAQQDPPHEGRWSITAVADAGHCERSYRLPIEVEDGNVRYAGWFGVDASGRVDESGRLTMQLVQGGDVVDARGHLGAETGEGRWESPGCAGTWRGRKKS